MAVGSSLLPTLSFNDRSLYLSPRPIISLSLRLREYLPRSDLPTPVNPPKAYPHLSSPHQRYNETDPRQAHMSTSAFPISQFYLLPLTTRQKPRIINPAREGNHINPFSLSPLPNFPFVSLHSRKPTPPSRQMTGLVVRRKSTLQDIERYTASSRSRNSGGSLVLQYARR